MANRTSVAAHGPTLTANRSLLTGPEPVCATCPVGSWYLSDGKLRCFCAAYRADMYGGRLGPVTACDEYEAALDAKAKKLAEGAAPQPSR